MPEIRHWVDAHVALARPFGIAASDRDWRPRLNLSAADRARAEAVWDAAAPGQGTVDERGSQPGRPRVLVNPFSASADRQWPLERFLPVIRHLRRRLPCATVVVPTMAAGDPGAEELASQAGARAVPLALPEVTAVTATADLVISPDTAVTVIASAFQVPVLALMRRDTEQWVPYRVAGAVAFSDDPRSLQGLPEERVVAVLDSVIDSLGPARGWL
jgi:ADP-heptose:LPS heptosyltransferase